MDDVDAGSFTRREFRVGKPAVLFGKTNALPEGKTL
jgi:hypothetical protein